MTADLPIFVGGGGAVLIAVTAVLVVGLALLRRAATRPLTDYDLRQAEMEEQQDLREAARRADMRVSRFPAARAVVESTDGAVVLSFPRRLRMVRDDLDAAGDAADKVWPVAAPERGEIIDVGSMLTSDGLGGAA